jgi:hypothetical protein
MPSLEEQAIQEDFEKAWSQYRETMNGLLNPDARNAADYGDKIDAAVEEIYRKLKDRADRLKGLKG